MTPTRDQILAAASAGMLEVVLNVVPGIGVGYLYLYHWREYWTTSGHVMPWFIASAVLGQNADATAAA